MATKTTDKAANPLDGKDKEALLTMLLAQEITREEYSLALANLEEGALRKIVVYANPEKGTVSVGGLNKQFPVSLYPKQWERMISEGIPAVVAFLAKHKDRLPQAKGVPAKEKIPASMIGDGKDFRIPKGKPAAATEPDDE